MIERRWRTNRKHIKLLVNTRLRNKILHLLSTKDRGPDEILGRLKLEGWEVVSTTTLYRYIHINSPGWKHYLLHKSVGYRKRYASKQGIKYGDIPYCEEREAAREEVGHTECDSIECGSRKGGLTTSIFRHSRFGQMRKVSSLSGQETYRAMKEMLSKHEVRSITIDNGSEFCEIRKFSAKLYRCRAYASWEKGSIERYNGLIRRYIPKGTIISELTDEQIQKIENIINHKPRKILGYKTPYEVQFSINLTYTT